MAYLQPRCTLAELVGGFLRLLPAGRRFMQLALADVLDTILGEPSLDLGLPRSALEQGREATPPEQLLQSIQTTGQLVLAALAHHVSDTPKEALALAQAAWRSALASGLSHHTSLALVAQLLLGCWVAPMIAAPEAFGLHPEPLPNRRRATCTQSRTCRQRDGGDEPLIGATTDWLQALLRADEVNGDDNGNAGGRARAMGPPLSDGRRGEEGGVHHPPRPSSPHGRMATGSTRSVALVPYDDA